VKASGSWLVLATVVVCSAGVAAQAPQIPMFRSTANLVALNVTVQDPAARDKYISGLRSDDFVVYEDGVRQNVRFFESEAVPIDLIVLLDTSASMSDKIGLVRDAANGFLHTLRPGDRGAVVTFSDSVRVAQPLTEDRGLLASAVGGISAHGATALNNAVYIALKEFGRPAEHDGDVRRQAIAVLSDGDDTSSLVSFDDVLSVARRMGVNIYTVGLQSEFAMQQTVSETGHRYLDQGEYALKTLAHETGARAFFPKVNELKDVYATIARELSNQYSIGYVPSNSSLDGRFRRVVVQVATRPELRPRTRVGYTATGTSSSSEY
jgi:Ca-activated chloride channel family protein